MHEPELHLFIIWEKARHKEVEILADIREHFKILKMYEVRWSKKYFAKNLTRFYGLNLPPKSDKETHVGNGPFLAVIVQDKTPEYKVHTTSKGDALVNTKTFSAKTRGRELTGGGHRVHATNTPEEMEHDLTLLLGVNTADFLKELDGASKKAAETPEPYDRDIAGAGGWQSVEQLFYVLNATVRYIVMRNYEPLPHNYYADRHGDIDILTADYQSLLYIAGGTPVFDEPYRVHNKVRIGKQDVLFDFRFVGDGYYDVVWQEALLSSRTMYNGLFVPSREEYFYSLLYHALIHKPAVAEDYVRNLHELCPNKRWKVDTAFFVSGQAHKVLGRYLAKHGYILTVPRDLSVFMNQPNFDRVKRAIWYARPVKYGLRKAKSFL